MISRKLIIILVFLSPCFMFFVPCTNAADTALPSSPVKLIFIHHSTGGNWLADQNTDQPYGELGIALMNNNYFVSATNYGWGPESIGDRTDIPNWPEWFTGTNSTTILQQLYSENGQNVGDFGAWARLAADPGGENEIILFKSCFPNSDLYGSPSDAPAAAPGDQYTVSNAKAVYNNLLTYFQTRQDKLFVVITAPPQNENEYSQDYQTPAERAANARAFNNWLVNDWLDDYTHGNVAVFDYFNVLTATDNHHRWGNGAVQHVTPTAYNFSAYPTDTWDSHPNTDGQTKATNEFIDLLNYFYNVWISGENGDTENGFNHLAYLAVNPDLPRNWGKAECLSHYILYGFAETRASAFNTQEYLAANPDLPSNWTRAEALNHYNMYGKFEKRLLAFDAGAYTSLYGDLPGNWTYSEALTHYYAFGRTEGRIPSFDETAYLEMYPDLPAAWGKAEAFNHYWLYGRYEGRVYDPYDESIFGTPIIAVSS